MTKGEDESASSSVSVYIPGIFFVWGIVARGEEGVEGMVMVVWESAAVRPRSVSKLSLITTTREDVP